MTLDKLCGDIQKYLNSDSDASTPSEDDRRNALQAAKALCTQLETPMEALLRFAWIEPAYSACVKIALDIGLFQALGSRQNKKHCTILQLAESTGTDPKLLERILRMLASMGTVAEIGGGEFTATGIPTALLERPCSATAEYRFIIGNPLQIHLPRYLKETKYRNPNNLMESPWQLAYQTKLSAFEYIGQDAAMLEMFTNHMAAYTSARGTWESVYPIRERLLGEEDIGMIQDTILVDIGGGSGHDLKRFAQNWIPHAQKPYLVLQDLPEVAETELKHEECTLRSSSNLENIQVSLG